MSLAALAIAIPRLVSLAAIAAILVLTVVAGRGLGLREWLSFLSVFRVLVPAIFVLNVLFYGGGDVLVEFPVVPVSVTTEGVRVSVLIAARLLVVAGIASWFASTTEPEAFEVALTEMGVPWRFAFVLSLTLRLVPVMRRRFRMIEEAQRARGLRIEGGPIRRARARIPILVPFLVSIVTYGYELADALEVRGFEGATARSHLVCVQHGRIDYLFYALAVAIPVAFVAVFR